LAQNKNTDFAGYSVPHPYEPKMNLRLQTIGEPAKSVLKTGLKELEETANILDDVFIVAMTKHIEGMK
jgi:DNA-directed RNA polymerase I and III subunit RPAC2